MKVVFLITRLDYSGGPKMLAWVTNQFAKAGHEVHLISIYSNEVCQPLDENIVVHYINNKQSKNRVYRNTIEVVRDVKSIDNTIQIIAPDLVISFLYSIDIYYMIYSKHIKKNSWKFIVSLRMDPYSEKRISDKIRHHFSTFADGYVFQTDGAQKYFSQNVEAKSTVICNPVTARTISYRDKVKPFNDRRNIIVVPARLNIPQKRQDVAIQAMKIIATQYPSMKMVLLGNGPDKEKLQILIDKEGLSDVVIIHPAVQTAEEFISDCKIMLLTSDYEGIPNSLIESMALGVNVVATDCSPGGARMLIKNKKNGFLVTRGDYRGISDAVFFLLRNTKAADMIAEESKKIATEYSEQEIGKKWVAYAKKVLSE